MKKWLFSIVLSVCVFLFVGRLVLLRSPKVVEISQGKRPLRWGAINVFDGILDALADCNSEKIRLFRIKDDIPQAMEIYQINCLCDAVLVEDWRLTDALVKAGIKVPIFFTSGTVSPFEKVVYAPRNEMFVSQLSTSSKALVEKCAALFGEEVIGNELEREFTNIYRNGLWGRNEEGEGFSGAGCLPENAQPFMVFLETFLKENDIHSVVELGCGDWTMQRHIDWGDIDYTGIDWVKYILDRDQREFGSEKVRFIHGDALTMELPKADLVICKEMFQHLSNRDTKRLLEKCRQYPHCLFVDDYDPTARRERDIPSSGYLPTSLMDVPFQIDGQKLLRYEIGGCHKLVVYWRGEEH